MPTTSTTQPAAAVHEDARARDVLTVAALLGAALLLVLRWGVLWAALAWLIGAVLLWSSPSWTAREKVIGTAVWPGGLIGPTLLLTRAGQVCTQTMGGPAGVAVGEPSCTGFALDPWIGVPVGVAVLLAPVVVGFFLLTRSGRPASCTC